MEEETVDPILYATAQHLIIPSRHPMCFSGAYGPQNLITTNWSGQYVSQNGLTNAATASQWGTVYLPLHGPGVMSVPLAVFSSAWGNLPSLAWPGYQPKLPRRDSKQTRAYYRVRARAAARRKVRVHVHRRRSRGN